MGLLIERIGFWRTWAGSLAAVLVAAVTFLAVGKTIAPPKEEPRELTVDGDLALRASVVRTDLARAASLWTQTQLECRVTAFYEVMDSAHFLPVANVAPAAHGGHQVSLTPAPYALVTVERSAAFALAA